MKKLLLGIVYAAFLLISCVSYADTFDVSVQVNGGCTLTNASDISFPAQTIVGGQVPAVIEQIGTFDVTCTLASDQWFATADNGILTTRKMQNSSGYQLDYRLYRTTGSPTDTWGNAKGTDTIDGTGPAGTTTHNFYADIPGPQTPTGGTGSIAGLYSDTVTTDLDF